MISQIHCVRPAKFLPACGHWEQTKLDYVVKSFNDAIISLYIEQKGYRKQHLPLF